MFYPRSAYLHIPFCNQRCFYCDFTIIPLEDNQDLNSDDKSDLISSYLKLIKQEIRLVKKCFPLSTIYIGGGTPSILTPAQLKDLLECLESKFMIQDGAEITLEIDPATFTQKDLCEYIKTGINRFSLGVQSFDNDMLRSLGRKHFYKHIIESCSWLDDAYQNRYINSWSIDLIQNLPEQNTKEWINQLKEAVTIKSPHLSIYDLIIEESTRFSYLDKRKELNLPSEINAMKMSRLTNYILKKNGFSRYEISNFSLPMHASRHNRVYWNGRGWWAFGQGATSCPWGKRFTRPKTFNGYQNWIKSQLNYHSEPSLLKNNYHLIPLDDLLITGLRRREGVDIEKYATKWGWNTNQKSLYIQRLENYWYPWIEQGLILKRGKRFFLTDPHGMNISNQVLVAMLKWWESLPIAAVTQPIL